MSIDYHINPEDGLISLRADALLTIEELHGCGERLLADGAFEPSLPHLIDLREASLDTLCRTDPQLAQNLVQRYNGSVHGSVAVLIDASEAGEHLADVYQMTCGLLQAELFDSYDHAMRWLIKKEFAPSPEQRAAQARSLATAPEGALRPLGQQPDPSA